MDKGKVIAYGTHDELIQTGRRADPHRPDAQRGRREGAGGVADGRRRVRHRLRRTAGSRLWWTTPTGCCRVCSRPHRKVRRAHHVGGYPGAEPGDGVPAPDRAGHCETEGGMT
ncbi:MAG: hypothetical protein MZU84_07010 [Sphingobacterium sp.]|nr:hypothetical protein [Sphingobacterium sp.]